MDDIKKGQKVNVLDPDGRGTTQAKVVEPGTRWVKVRWLEARWDLTQNSMIARKGTTSEVPLSSIQ